MCDEISFFSISKSTQISTLLIFIQDELKENYYKLKPKLRWQKFSFSFFTRPQRSNSYDKPVVV